MTMMIAWRRMHLLCRALIHPSPLQLRCVNTFTLIVRLRCTCKVEVYFKHLFRSSLPYMCNAACGGLFLTYLCFLVFLFPRAVIQKGLCPLQQDYAAKRAKLDEGRAAPVLPPPAAAPAAQQEKAEALPEGPAHLHISGLPTYLTEEKVNPNS